jgi:hypothetical protein
MATANNILTLAKKQIGTKENPPYSNKVVYNTEYYGKVVTGSAYPWCVVFIWWLFKNSAAADLFYGGGKTASCNELLNWYKKQGMWHTSGFRPGDLVFYDFNGKGVTHMGIIEKVAADSVTTIEGNTSVSSNADGGSVMRRTRYYSQIAGVARPAYEEEAVSAFTYEMFKEYAKRYEAEQRELPVSEWANDSWQKAVATKLLDGTMPRSPLTREQLAVVLNRLDLIK